MWNYVYLKAYLDYKEPTEYNGNESYIAKKIMFSDLGWFPINRALEVKDELTEEKEMMDLADSINQNVKN